jgi:hypothetical protein
MRKNHSLTLRSGILVFAFGITAKTLVPSSYPATWSAPFAVLPTLSNVVGTLAFDWALAMLLRTAPTNTPRTPSPKRAVILGRWFRAS